MNFGASRGGFRLSSGVRNATIAAYSPLRPFVLVYARAWGPRFFFVRTSESAQGEETVVDLETPLRSLLSELGLDLYDLEMVKGTLNVVVTKPGGVDLESLTKANRQISEWLDVNDPIPGRFTLDVSSPGLERKLRTPAHFISTIGEVVTLREIRSDAPTRRLEGTVLAADETSVTLDDPEHGHVVVPIESIERARTVFKWGAEAKPSPSRAKSSASSTRKGG
jgi:ribosome maturation factor RimP